MKKKNFKKLNKKKSMLSQSPKKRIKFEDSTSNLCLQVTEIQVANEIPNDIYHYLKSKEKYYNFSDLPSKYITLTDRNMIVKSMLDITMELNISDHTFQLSVVLLDISLKIMNSLKLNALQLTSMACFLIASKMRCVKCVSISKILKLMNSCYNAETLYKAEIHILSILEWKVLYPTIQDFIGFHLSEKNNTEKQWSDVRILANLVICDFQYCKWSMNKLAKACIDHVLGKVRYDECFLFVSSQDK